jgi:hypothetical protein
VEVQSKQKEKDITTASPEKLLEEEPAIEKPKVKSIIKSDVFVI